MVVSLDALLGRPSPQRQDGPPQAPPPTSGPAMRQLGRELGAGWQAVRLLRAAPWLARAPRGEGAVIDLPGWRAPEASNAPLRAYLRLLGYDASSWGLGINRGQPLRYAAALVERLSAERREPLALVGWSLGGVVAREVARALGERVRCVITYGTPVIGGPAYTFAARLYGQSASRRASSIRERLDAERPISVPITAIYTRADGIVDWRACIDRRSPNVRHVEVRSGHLGLGIDPDVWWVVAQALAEREV